MKSSKKVAKLLAMGKREGESYRVSTSTFSPIISVL